LILELAQLTVRKLDGKISMENMLYNSGSQTFLFTGQGILIVPGITGFE